MKKYILASVALVLLLVVAGCNKEVLPEDRFAEYVDLWNEQQFDEMYKYLSTETKEQVTKEDFTERYTKIYEDLEIANLKISFKNPEEETDKKAEEADFSFSAKMDSLAGEIAFDHEAIMVKEERDEEANWYLNWDTTFIFPELQEGDKIRVSTTSAFRGNILDKNGDGLAVNGEAYEIGIVPANIEGKETEIIQQVSKLLGVSTEQIENALNASWVQPDYFVPIKKIALDERELLEKLVAIDGVMKKNVNARVYPLGEAAAHLIGYVGPITAEELEKQKGKGYSSTDVIGKRGMEQVLEERLKGEKGAKISIEKEDGTEELLAEIEVVNGENIYLTIDSSIQNKVFGELQGEAGTASAIDPVTGETIALVSSPSFNPNIVSLGATSEQWKALEENPQNPLLTRFKATYAPGSVMKPITASVGLAAGKVKWDKTMNVEGLQWQKDDSWGDHYVTRVSAHSNVNLEKAFLYSDNIYFAQAALEIGKDDFTSGLKKFGFGVEEYDYAYPIEVSKYGKIDSEGILADSGYGQGQIEMSALHLTAAYTPFVNNGNMIKPILLADEEQGQIWQESLISKEDANKINGALSKVVQDPSGTAHSGHIEGYPLAGKTGTAELKGAKGEKGKENGWFIAYNTENPSLLIALMVEGVQDRGGSKVAVEKVKNIFEYYKNY